MSAKEKFCSHLRAQVKDESMAVGEYVALALEALESGVSSGEVISILLEKVRDDEKSHHEALIKVEKSVCPIDYAQQKDKINKCGFENWDQAERYYTETYGTEKGLAMLDEDRKDVLKQIECNIKKRKS